MGQEPRDLLGLATHEPGLADSGHHHATGSGLVEPHRAAKVLVEAGRRTAHSFAYGPQDRATAGPGLWAGWAEDPNVGFTAGSAGRVCYCPEAYGGS